ncbi:MAG: hypothetical protein LBD48_06575 [Treponema sp.]|jgi:hypothetical protein|nr:hypothetical protein [Treponema sp.]
MDETPFLKLNLRAPLQYMLVSGLPPFSHGEEGRGETLFCFELDAGQGQSIEPDSERLLGPLVFSGQAADAAGGAVPAVELPAGHYFFSQKRAALSREECIALAVEQQKDGLWERLQPENRLYIRYLFEDGKLVTQLFRPCRGVQGQGRTD